MTQKKIQRLRGQTSQISGIAGLPGLTVIDTLLHQLRIYDGFTVGGHVLVPWNQITIDAEGSILLNKGENDQHLLFRNRTPYNLSATSDSVDVNEVDHSGVTVTYGHSHVIDSTIARSAITVGAGNGLTGGGNLTANRTLSVDGTVVRTSGNQTLAGDKTFTGRALIPDGTRLLPGLALSANPASGFFSNNTGSLYVTVDGIAHSGFTADRAFRIYNVDGSASSHLVSNVAGSAKQVTLPDADVTLVGGTMVNTLRGITAGNGLTGGGNLSSDRTLTLGTPSTLTATSTNTVTAASHTHGIDSTIARSAINFTAGMGLSGGGNLTASRTIQLGIPDSVSDNSSNEVSAVSHTHAFDNASVNRIIGASTIVAVGMYVFAKSTNAALAIANNTVVAGNTIRFSDTSNTSGPVCTSASPQFRCQGNLSPGQATLFLRIS